MMERVEDLVCGILDLGDHWRKVALDLLAERMCMHCGWKYTERHPICHCENDE